MAQAANLTEDLDNIRANASRLWDHYNALLIERDDQDHVLAVVRNDLAVVVRQSDASEAKVVELTTDLQELHREMALRDSRLLSRTAQYLATYGVGATLLRVLQPWRWGRHTTQHENE